MREWTPRIILLGLLVVIIGLPLLFRRGDDAGAAMVSGSAERLVIVSPHNEQIRHEFSRGFNLHRAANNKPPVRFDWRSSGGTSDLRKQVNAEYAAKARDYKEEQGVGYDLFFGGGAYDHGELAKGVRVTRAPKDDAKGAAVEETVAIVEPIVVPREIITQTFPDPDIGGSRLYWAVPFADGDPRAETHMRLAWTGAALSSFGIVYNRDLTKMLGVDEPQTWADLADPRYTGYIALADPGHSGSIATTYAAILRRLGWTEGWALLRRSFANAKYFTNSASKVPVDVSRGETAAGMCIDFYGRFQAEAVGGNLVGYVDPPFMTAIDADPITLMRGAPNRALAEEFILWVITREGQALWQRRVGTPGGPEQFELRRLPIRRDMYTDDETAMWSDPQAKPFEIAKPFAPGVPDFRRAVDVLSHAMAIDVHDDLKAAWIAIERQKDPTRRARMLELFDAMPAEITLTWPEGLGRDWQAVVEDPTHPDFKATKAVLDDFNGMLRDRWASGDQKLKDRLDWTIYFRDNYRKIVAMGK